jgi:hypothetical protein
MIDRTFDKKYSAINFYADTIFDKESLKGFLKSENKLTDKTRLSLEFLKINIDPIQLKKYSDFIYDNYKSNVNLNLKDETFEEKIKRGIIDIVFEKNGLIYIKSSNKIAEKEKEEADKDNYKIINCKYSPIIKKTLQKDIDNYFNKNGKEEENQLKNEQKNKKEIINICKQDKKTCGFAIVQITRDVLGDSMQLMLSAECKKRTQRIKSKLRQAFDYVFQGGMTKNIRYKKGKTRKYYRT